MSDQGINEPGFSEFELRQALAGHAASIDHSDGLDRLAAGMVHADRMHTVRVMAGATAVVVMVTIGALSLGGGAESSVDVVDQPTPTLPEGDLALPDIGDPDADTETEADADHADSTTTSAPTTTLAPVTEPDHLEPADATTTTSVAVVSTTTTAPPTTTTTTQAPTTTVSAIAFTATALYQSCSEDPPYDEYSGTAAPGTTITVTSAYNDAAQVTAGAGGDWWLKVYFPTAPEGETFSVTVSDGTTSHNFNMIHTA